MNTPFLFYRTNLETETVVAYKVLIVQETAKFGFSVEANLATDKIAGAVYVDKYLENS